MRLRGCTPPATPTTTSATSCSDADGAVRGRVHRRVDAVRRHRPHRPGRPRAHRRADPRPVPLGAPAGRRAARRHAEVYPTHGFGSFCSATPTSGDASTIGEQRTNNPALTQDEQDYVDKLIAGLDAYPAYYAHMGVINRRGPAPVDLSLPQPVDPAELRRRIEAGEWVVDLRDRTAFAAGHLAGSLGFELSDNFVTYLGWLYPWGAPLTLIGDDHEQVADARRELVRIGVDNLAGAAIGDIHTLADGTALRSYRVADFAGLAEAIDRRRPHGAGRPPQRRDAPGHVAGAINIPLHELADRIDEVPAGEVWVYCGSGYRASIAASMLDRPEPHRRPDRRLLRRRRETRTRCLTPRPHCTLGQSARR